VQKVVTFPQKNPRIFTTARSPLEHTLHEPLFEPLTMCHAYNMLTTSIQRTFTPNYSLKPTTSKVSTQSVKLLEEEASLSGLLPRPLG
jgi:hypothetical protein